MSTGHKTLEVSIFGRSYRVACEDNEREALLQAVAYVDTKMNEVRKSAKVSGTERIAVMVALNMAHELLATKLDGGYDLGHLKRRLAAIESTVEAALASQEKLF